MKRTELKIKLRQLRHRKLLGQTSYHLTPHPQYQGAPAAKINAAARKLFKESDWKTYLWLAWDSFLFPIDAGMEDANRRIGK